MKGRIIWSKGNSDKLKGKGIAIFVSNKWAAHIGKITHHNEFMITVKFQFK